MLKIKETSEFLLNPHLLPLLSHFLTFVSCRACWEGKPLCGQRVAIQYSFFFQTKLLSGFFCQRPELGRVLLLQRFIYASLPPSLSHFSTWLSSFLFLFFQKCLLVSWEQVHTVFFAFRLVEGLIVRKCCLNSIKKQKNLVYSTKICICVCEI